MNLIPFVTILLIILSLFSLSHFKSSASLAQEKTLYTDYFHSLRNVRNKREHTCYKEARKRLHHTPRLTTSPSKKPSNPNKQTESPLFNPVDRHLLYPTGCLNLSSLVDNPTAYPQLKIIATRYLIAIYSHASFFPKDPSFTHQLIEQLVHIQTMHKEPLPLHTVILPDATTHKIFYKMLKGTHTYHLTNKVGYPPLHKLLTFDTTKERRAPINFAVANIILLECVLGKHATERLLSLERPLVDGEDPLPLPVKTSNELERALDIHIPSTTHSACQLLDFTVIPATKKPEEQVGSHTNITVRID